MKFIKLAPLAAALATAFVIPDEQAIQQAETRSRGKLSEWKGKFSEALDSTKHAIDDALESAFDDTSDVVDKVTDYAHDEYTAAEGWFSDFRKAREHDFEAVSEKVDKAAVTDMIHDLGKKSKQWYDDLDIASPGCPHSADEGDEHHKRPHHGKPHHPHKPNQTVYELIKKSKYTTKLAKLVDRFPDVVEKLNGSESHFTFFAPIDKAFEKIPEHGKEPPKEFLLKLLQYHVVPDVVPAGRVLKSRTLETVLEGSGLSEKPRKTPQRLSIVISLKGLLVNYYSRIVAINVFGTNGVIHGVDSILIPPPKAATIVQALPGTFSTLELALWKTGLISALNDTSNHLGGTLFPPTNGAWEKLGARANGFLFSRYGRKYLKALVKYHVVPNITLYSDALYTHKPHSHKDDTVDAKRTFHVDLPTLLKGKSLSVDVAEFSRFVDIRINGFNHVQARDLPAFDGVLHSVGYVLIPPKTPGGKAEKLSSDVSVEDLKERLEPFVEEDDSAFDNLKVDYVKDEHSQRILSLEL